MHIQGLAMQGISGFPPGFFHRPAERVAPDLIGCLLLKHPSADALLWGVVVETEAYDQDDPACHGHRRRSPSNETLFGEPGHWYVYVSYGIHHCVNVMWPSETPASAWILRGFPWAQANAQATSQEFPRFLLPGASQG